MPTILFCKNQTYFLPHQYNDDPQWLPLGIRSKNQVPLLLCAQEDTD